MVFAGSAPHLALGLPKRHAVLTTLTEGFQYAQPTDEDQGLSILNFDTHIMKETLKLLASQKLKGVHMFPMKINHGQFRPITCPRGPSHFCL